MARSIDGLTHGWWFEDAVAGETIRHPGGRTIDDTEHVWLAWITHNVSDAHGNADAASRTEWGRPLVLGVLTVAIVIGLAAPAMATPETVGPTLRAGWHAITLEGVVRAGDTLRAESVIEQVGDGPEVGFGTVVRTIVGRKQDGSVVVRIRERRAVLRHGRSRS